MALSDQVITDDYAIYNGDCVEVVADMPSNSVDMSVYSPPFAGLFQYSGDERDMSNCTSHGQFYDQYRFLIQHMHRITKPGRINAVHCMDIGTDSIGSVHDLPGNIVRLHEEAGFKFMGRRLKWNEPLAVRLRTMVRGLAHQTICEDQLQVQHRQCGLRVVLPQERREQGSRHARARSHAVFRRRVHAGRRAPVPELRR